MKVLITGGAGYIGSTIASALEDNGHIPVILDSLVTGCPGFTHNRIFYQGDISDSSLIKSIFKFEKDIECTIHCAALTSVSESTERTYEYYNENVIKSIKLFKTLIDVGCKKIIFSSSASVYGDNGQFQVKEDSPLYPNSPYARTKYIDEMILEDMCKSYNLKGITLRYFNPIGSDPKGRTGMYKNNATNVLSKLNDVLKNDGEEFKITGCTWDTRDGTGVRDYIHIWDLALAHVYIIDKFDNIFNNSNSPYMAFNLGSGVGTTVKELVSIFENVSMKKIKTCEVDAHEGDIAGAYANISKIQKFINWSPIYNVSNGVMDFLKWESSKNIFLKSESINNKELNKVCF